MANSLAAAAQDWVVRKLGKHLRWPFNDWLEGQSLIGRQTFFDEAQVPGIAVLKRNWPIILEEAKAVIAERESIPPLGEISHDHRRIAGTWWKSYFFKGYGYRAVANCARCPKTAALLDQVPNVVVAFFSIFEPGTYVPSHRGVTKAMLNVHLPLMVPQEQRCEIRVNGETRRWQQGEFLIFDETFDHEAWNESDEPRVVLFLQVMRPMRWPGRLASSLFFWGMKRTSYVQEARRAIGAG